jgi:hypothetical protein
MVLCPISLVSRKTILRIELVELDHQTISFDFSHNRGARNGIAHCVASHKAQAAITSVRKPYSVYDGAIRRRVQPIKSLKHGTSRRLENVPGIDPRGRNRTD